MKKNTKNNERGFSLVELLVTLGIVGVLASVAVPSYQEYMKSILYKEQRLYYNQLRTAYEAGLGDAGPTVGTVYKFFNKPTGAAWQGALASQKGDILPGFPDHLGLNFMVYVQSWDCSSSGPTCNVTRLFVANCEDGTLMQSYIKKNGAVSYTEPKNGWYDSFC